MEFSSPIEARAFEYYRIQSAPVLGNIMDSDFWGGLVLRLSVSEPIVRHAVLALSSLHEFVSTRHLKQQPQIDPALIFYEYGKAINALRKWEPVEGPMIPLLTSLLFTCLEFMMDHEQGAKLHILQGRNLLCDLGSGQPSVVDMVKTNLVPMYTRLGLAAFLYGSCPPPVPENLKSFSKPPAQFKDMAEARSCLYQLLDEGLRFSVTVKPMIYKGENIDVVELQAKQQKMLSYLSQWNAAFTVLTSSMRSNHSGLSVQHLLKIYYHAAVIWLSTSLSPQEEAYDAHLGDFAAIVQSASTILNASHRGSQLHAFSFETELVAPIYWTVTKCRHPALRRAALKLLLQDELLGRRENLWNSNEAVTIAMRVIQLEEQSEKPEEVEISSPGSVVSMPATEHRVPLDQPPTIPVELAETTDGLEILSTVDTRSSAVENQLARLNKLETESVISESPFGVPEFLRIKNVIIGPREKTGVWTTMFFEPAAGANEWTVAKEFLKLVI